MKLSQLKPKPVVDSKPSDEGDMDQEIEALEQRLKDRRRIKKPAKDLVGAQDSKWKLETKAGFSDRYEVVDLDDDNLRMDLISKHNEDHRIAVVCAGNDAFFLCLSWKEDNKRTIEMDYVKTVDLAKAINATIQAFHDLNIPF